MNGTPSDVDSRRRSAGRARPDLLLFFVYFQTRGDFRLSSVEAWFHCVFSGGGEATRPEAPKTQLQPTLEHINFIPTTQMILLLSLFTFWDLSHMKRNRRGVRCDERTLQILLYIVERMLSFLSILDGPFYGDVLKK